MKVPENKPDSGGNLPTGGLMSAPGREDAAGGRNAVGRWEAGIRAARQVEEVSRHGVAALEELTRLKHRVLAPEFSRRFESVDFEDLFDDSARLIREQAVVRINDPEARKVFTGRFDRWENSARLAVREHARRVAVQEAEAGTLAALETLGRLALAADGARDTRGLAEAVEMARGVVAGKTAAGVMDEEAGARMLDAWRGRLAEGVWSARVARASDLRELSGLSRMLEKAPASLDPDTRSRLSARVGEKLEATHRAAAVERAFAGLARRFGNDPATAAKHLADPDNAAQLGLNHEEATVVAGVLAARARDLENARTAGLRRSEEEQLAPVFDAMERGERTRALLMLASADAVSPERAARVSEALARDRWDSDPAAVAAALAAARKGELADPVDARTLLGHGLAPEDVRRVLSVMEAETGSRTAWNHYEAAERGFVDMLTKTEGIGAPGADERLAGFRTVLSDRMERAGLTSADPETGVLGARLARVMAGGGDASDAAGSGKEE